MTGRRIAYGFLLLGSAAFWIFYDGAVSAYLFAAVLVLPFFSLLVSLPFARKPAAEIEAPRTVQRGSACSFFFRVRVHDRPSVLPGAVRVAIRDLMEDRIDRLTFDNPESGSVLFHASHSGVWQAEILSAYLCDFLGIWRFPAAPTPPVRLTVPPVPTVPEPPPDFGLFRSVALRPRPGGGYSEIHELREYRPGDPLRTVHWKATAKTDSPVVREAQEALSRRALVTYALSSDRSAADRIFDNLVWVSGKLIAMDIPHAALSMADGRLFSVAVRDDLTAMTEALLSAPLPKTEPASPPSPPPADWVFRIGEQSAAEHEKEGTP